MEVPYYTGAECLPTSYDTMNETAGPMEVPYYTGAECLPTSMNETAGTMEADRPPTYDLDAADAAVDAAADDPTRCRPIPWIDDQNKCGMTSLHYACRNGNIEMVRLLLQRGAATSIKDNDKYTPFHYAALNGDTEIMALLLAAADAEL